MRRLGTATIIAFGLLLGACDTGGNKAATTTADMAAGEADNAMAPGNATAAAAEPAKPACLFRETSEWNASVTSGELLVNGKVDVMMAGFKPTLTRRAGASGVFAFDLALVPEAGAVVNDRVRYEESGVPRHPRAEIYCGGERIETIDVVLVVD